MSFQSASCPKIQLADPRRPKCPQPAGPNNSGLYQSHLDFPDVGESEFDCLNLSITRPSPAALAGIGLDPARDKLPVYFYIHGGGFGFGAGSDPIWGKSVPCQTCLARLGPFTTDFGCLVDPTRIVLRSLKLRKPFIAVLINYRLNIFGFAASSILLDSQEASALKGCNFGIHDQRMALDWVTQNIAGFGGDPANITLGGQSAGGCSVHAHLLDAISSPELPLFKRAIIQSGTLTSASIGPTPIEECDKRWDTLCAHLKLRDLPKREQLESLRTIKAQDLIKAGEELGWMVFFLASDNVTITTLSQTEWKINFNLHARSNSSQFGPVQDPIKILIGDTEAEVSEPFALMD